MTRLELTLERSVPSVDVFAIVRLDIGVGVVGVVGLTDVNVVIQPRVFDFFRIHIEVEDAGESR